MRLAPLLALCLAGCLSPPPGWIVLDATPEQTTHALGMVDAARRVSGLPLVSGQISIATDLGMRGLGRLTGTSYTLNGICAVEVLPDLGALGHELAHCAGASEAEADHLGAMIEAEYRRTRP